MTLASSGAPVTNATIPFTLKDASGNTIATGSLNYVGMNATNTGGNYQGYLANTAPIVVGVGYFLELPATSGGVVTKPIIECGVENLDETFS